MKEIKRKQPNPQVQSCSVTPQKGLHLKSIMLGNEIVSSFIDTGSTVSLIREDVSTKIVDHSRLSKINTVLYGLGQTEVITKGSFKYDFVLDKDQYSLTWHVVPTKQLNFEAIIGTDILGQASLNFTQEGVTFHKPEEKACLMPISGVHPEDELDFSHILDSQVKNDLTRITSLYKPEKTESTYKSVNKHIEKWLEQGIVRPSSSEYASPIVLVKNKKTYKKRKKAPEYQAGDLVAVQRTQFGGGLKLRPKFFRPYQITEVKPRDRYTVEKDSGLQTLSTHERLEIIRCFWSSPHPRSKRSYKDISINIKIDVCIHEIAPLQHRSTDDYENYHVYVFFCGEGFGAILFVATPHQVALQYIDFCTVQSIAKLTTWSPKMMSTWLYRQHFAMFLLNHYYDVRNGVAYEHYKFSIKQMQQKVEIQKSTTRGLQESKPKLSAGTPGGEKKFAIRTLNSEILRFLLYDIYCLH
ncbi:transposon Tf2-6 polyprotein [Trichonephila clavipes]|nr:transposon Tf2-6 polyprotein [Trichonephila clavipes]